MFLISTGTSVPPWRYSQEACWENLSRSDLFRNLEGRSQAILRKVLLGRNGISSRHFALPSLDEVLDVRPETLQGRFEHHAPELAAAAGRKALAESGLEPGEIEGLLISTCTGYLCPGLTSYVLESLGLNRDITCLDLVGQGCGAALPNLRLADSLLRAGTCQRVLSICVEVCSAAFYLDDDPGVLISACLFGDGAGAAVLSRYQDPERRRIRWKASATMTIPGERDQLRFEHRHGLLRNILAPTVPALAAHYARAVFETVQKQTSVGPEQITAWLWHAGGRDVLGALQKEFELTEEDIRYSADVLDRVGNISSPFVLHVLDEACRGGAPGGHWWMASFGAGFSSHGALWEVE